MKPHKNSNILAQQNWQRTWQHFHKSISVKFSSQLFLCVSFVGQCDGKLSILSLKEKSRLIVSFTHCLFPQLHYLFWWWNVMWMCNLTIYIWNNNYIQQQMIIPFLKYKSKLIIWKARSERCERAERSKNVTIIKEHQK